jgi:hypothetical protein
MSFHSIALITDVGNCDLMCVCTEFKMYICGCSVIIYCHYSSFVVLNLGAKLYKSLWVVYWSVICRSNN